MDSLVTSKIYTMAYFFVFISFFVKANAQDIYKYIDGADVVADDGTYLGKISSNTFDSESIKNEFGKYGNEFNSNSIRNKFGKYGKEFSDLSPFNKFTTTPPRIIKNGEVIGYLTKNKSFENAVDPRKLLKHDLDYNSYSPKSEK